MATRRMSRRLAAPVARVPGGQWGAPCRPAWGAGVMGALVAVLLLLAGCGGASSGATGPAVGASVAPAVHITVRDTGGWVTAPLRVAPGDRLTIGYAGSLASGTGPAGTTALASGGAPLPGVFADAIIGRVGTGTPFYVGASFDEVLLPSSGSGRLALRVNASPGDAGGFACGLAAVAPARVPLFSTFAGNAVMRVYDPSHQGFAGPYTERVVLHAAVDGSRTLIALTGFAPIIVGPVATALGTDTITVSPVYAFGAFGPYGPSSALDHGAVRGLALTLRFQNSLGIAGSCLAPVVFTTGRSTSPGGHFHGSGTPFGASGAVTLVGTSRFACDALYNPTDGKDVVMSIAGILTPAP